jgi:hypothetical protein
MPKPHFPSSPSLPIFGPTEAPAFNLLFVEKAASSFLQPAGLRGKRLGLLTLERWDMPEVKAIFIIIFVFFTKDGDS